MVVTLGAKTTLGVQEPDALDDSAACYDLDQVGFGERDSFRKALTIVSRALGSPQRSLDRPLPDDYLARYMIQTPEQFISSSNPTT